MINNVSLVGRLTKRVDLRSTQSGDAVANFNLAVERSYTDANGNRQTDFIPCVIWKKSAETFASFTAKGSLVGVEGRIQTRNYENNQGQRVFVTEVYVASYSLLESKEVTEQRKQAEGQQGNPNNQNYNQNQPRNNQNNQAPNNQMQNNPAPTNQWSNQNADQIHVRDEDLPF